MASIFTKIINGEIPSYKVYEDEKTYAFLDIHPIQPGHVLVASKTEVESFKDLSEEDYSALMLTVKKVAKKIDEVYSPVKVAVVIEGFDVPHAHVHVFPAQSGADVRKKQDMNTSPSNDEMSEIRDKLSLDS